MLNLLPYICIPVCIAIGRLSYQYFGFTGSLIAALLIGALILLLELAAHLNLRSKAM